MCAKVISISYTCLATYNNQKTTPGQEVHKFYLFQALFLAYWGFQKYQNGYVSASSSTGKVSWKSTEIEPLNHHTDPLE